MTTQRLDPFPDPGQPSTPPTWEDILRLAMRYPAAHAVVTLNERGDFTREQALVSLVYWFASSFSQQFQRETDALAREVLDKIAREPCGCSRAVYVRRREVLMSCERHREGQPDA